MKSDDEIENFIRSQSEPEQLRQSLYKILEMPDKTRAFDLAVEYTDYPDWMIRRNAIMVLGQLKDKRAVSLLVGIIHKEIASAKYFQYGDKSDAYGAAIDVQIILACIEAIWQCGPTPEVASLLKYDNLSVPNYEKMIGEIKKLAETHDTKPWPEYKISMTVKADTWNQPARFPRDRKVVNPIDFYSVPGTQEYIHPSKPAIELNNQDKPEAGEHERQLVEKELELNALATQPSIHLHLGKIVDSIEVTINDTRYTTVKNKATPYEYIRKSLVECGLDDTSVKYDADSKIFTIKFGEDDGWKHDEITEFIRKHVVNLRYRINYKEIPDGYAISKEPPKYAGPIILICAIALISIILILALNGNNSVAPPNVTPTPKITQVPNVIVTQPPTIQYCDVGGLVVTKTGQGIAGATVVMGLQSVVTDKNGYYKVGRVPIGNCWIIVWNPAATGMIYEMTLSISGSTNSLNLIEGTYGN